MNIGIVGAGKMGFTLGKHLMVNRERLLNKRENIGTDKIDYDLIGYYSKSFESAKAASEFTNSGCYERLNELIEMCDTIFITVPDGQITAIVDELSRLKCDLSGKIICHTSGALSSNVFSGIGSQVYGYSVHPIYAVNSKTDSYKNFSESFITIEGSNEQIDKVAGLFLLMGHKVKVISDKDKPKYHCSAVFASNLVIGLYNMAARLLMECGFEKNEADFALRPLFNNNADNIVKNGCEKSLTGPIERCDEDTILKHMDTINGREKVIYSLLSQELIDIAIDKHLSESDSKTIDEEKDRYKKLSEIVKEF